MNALNNTILVFQVLAPQAPLSMAEWCDRPPGDPRYGVTGVAILQETVEDECRGGGCIVRYKPRPNEE